MKNWSRKLEIAANVGIVLIAFAILATLAKSYLFKPTRTKPETVAVGSDFTLDQFDWHASQATLLLALKPGCPYCEQSVPFYRSLSTSLHRTSKTRVVALLPDESPDPSAYIKELGIGFDGFRQISMPQAKIAGTPTILLVNDSGKVEKVWIGKLSAAQESEVVGTLSKYF